MTPSAPPETLSNLNALIEQGIQLLQQLQALLDTELNVLQARDIDQLQSSNKDKQQCLLAIDRNIRERNALLSQLQVGHDRRSVITFIAHQPEDDSARLSDAWDTLENELEQVKVLNQRNEQVLLRSKQSSDQLLALLQGHAQGNSIYDQKGDKGRYEGQRSLGKA
ncbi:flagella synthesis protein FlgN [Marinobacterium weihaiense]|uniref:Flagellar protein FlgN n=1 Tax=Marinobacterium weihaiense TaxID=2851016 RepID=A0ABS6MCN6_9GAMM|nr:flagellar protein FlgN [Marinobacterium weihaiense]MBV0934066.1 flagellar protein FlgN [Marinobacterium weihaiense]